MSSSDQHSSEAQLRSVLLTEWDGLTTDHTRNVVVMAATNNPAKLDVAIHRRLPRQVEVPAPDREQREAVLRVCLAGEELGELVEQVAMRTERYCGSDLMELCKGIILYLYLFYGFAF
jgi:SpoVK/Ycf46/Vps4 family AAA+-type ATPase